MNERTKYKIIKNRNYVYKGMSEISAIKGIIEIIILTAIWVQLKGIILPIYTYPIFGVTALIGCWFIGKMWDKTHLYDIETTFGNKRNPMLKEVWEKLCKKKDNTR